MNPGEMLAGRFVLEERAGMGGMSEIAYQEAFVIPRGGGGVLRVTF